MSDNNFEDYTDAYPKSENNPPPPPEQENITSVSDSNANLNTQQENRPIESNAVPKRQIPPQGYPYQQPYYPPPPPPPYYGNYYQQQGMFYGDMYAPRYAPPPVPPRQKCPPTPPAEPIPMNRKILVMSSVIAAMIFLLCIYCIIADLMHGALNSDSEIIQNTVVLQMQEKPELNLEDENVTSEGEYTVKGVAELVKPSIIEVYVYQTSENGRSVLSGTGSGIIISEDGYIITNAHVVQGDSYKVALDDESEYDAVLVGSDNKTDLAVLKVNARDLVPAVLGNSDEVYVGENVVAIGNPAGLANSVTKGIVSAINRQVRADSNGFMMDCIQTDAAISPGNSGGALVNMYGQVIGITSSKYASVYEATYEGLGFAITMNQALPVVQDLIENGYVSGRFRIGIVFMSANTEYAAMQFQQVFGEEMPEKLAESLWVSEISDECDISNTQLKPDDFILTMNGKKVSDYDEVLAVLDGCKGGDTVTAECARYEKGKIAYYNIEFKLEEDTSGDY